jgi:uncharacterized protein YfkK (UPF0435 family)
MILNNAPQDQAVLSNVGQIGEFRIRNSAKAFSILSSGLYANKIRAIIRELSCNAVDSHVAAGKSETPFDIHLPNALEPWFSIRDYGTGLDHAQVTNIYTTYFESTKTESNDFIGALGLGSKSPFSYTDNFTVTAIKDGRKGIYTAFINEHGVPSIALMFEEETTDPAGVEVKFSVNDKHDYEKFNQEARNVYEYFKLRPVVSGRSDFKFSDPHFEDRDIVPGVHTLKVNRAYDSISFAIMGNIAYPVNVPEADKTLGTLRPLLKCGLVMEFGIGELDFQASREGLSYVPLTIESIQKKLVVLNDQLVKYVAKEAEKIENLWERAVWLAKKRDYTLWRNAVDKYVTDTKFPLASGSTNRWEFLNSFKFTVEELREKYNIVIRGFQKQSGYQHMSTLKPRSVHNSVYGTFKETWEFTIDLNKSFVFNDTNVGALERAKHHWKSADDVHHASVYVIDAFVKGNPIKKQEFLDALMNPPSNMFFKASELAKKDSKARIGKNVSILKLEERRRSSWNTEWVWAAAGKIDSFSDSETFYYVEMSAWEPLDIPVDIKTLRLRLYESDVFKGSIYGVRKSDIEEVRSRKNWVSLNEMIKSSLGKLDTSNVMGMVKQSVDIKALYKYINVINKVDQNSPYVKLYNVFKDVKDDSPVKRQALEFLCKKYGITTAAKVDPNALIAKYNGEVAAIYIRYPLLRSLSHTVDSQAVAEYINLIDQNKGI